MKKWKKTICLTVALVFVLGIMLAAAGCGTQQPTAQQATLKVGTNAAFKPFEYHDKDQNGNDIITGYDIELIKAIAAKMGMQVEIVDMEFAGLISALDTGKIDVAIAGMTITDERKKNVDFSTPYYTDPEAGLVVAVMNDNNTIKSVDDLTGKKVAVQLGTTGDLEATKLKDAGKIAEVVRFDNVNMAFMEMKKGGVDAVINDLPVTKDFIDKNGYAKIVGKPFTQEQYGIAVKKGNTELLNKINKAIDDMKKSGEFDALFNKWFKNNQQ